MAPLLRSSDSVETIPLRREDIPIHPTIWSVQSYLGRRRRHRRVRRRERRRQPQTVGRGLLGVARLHSLGAVISGRFNMQKDEDRQKNRICGIGG